MEISKFIFTGNGLSSFSVSVSHLCFLNLDYDQVTKLRDGIAIGFSINHAVVDGTSLWHFINSWADLCRGAVTISHPPLHSRCFDIKGSRIALNLSITQTIDKFFPPPLCEKIFQFSKETIWRLKDRANRNNSKDPIIISSFNLFPTEI